MNKKDLIKALIHINMGRIKNKKEIESSNVDDIKFPASKLLDEAKID